MRIYSRDLRKAQRWLASGRSSKVIHFLEPKVPLFLEDPQYYALLGRACLVSGLLKDADTYLNRGLQADPSHMDVRLTLAVNHLKRKDPASAVKTWLEILEDDPKQKCARRGLKSLKRISDQDQQDRFLERFDITRFLPSLSSPWPARILAILLASLILLTILYFRDSIVQSVRSIGVGREYRPGSERLIPEKGEILSEDAQDVLYFMTEAEVARTLRNAVDHFQKYEDNSARYELNKIINSNAADEVRAQAAIIIESLGEATLENLETAYTYDDIHDFPELYEGCLVLWKGKTANVVIDSDAIRFDFLVGFEEGTVLIANVPVEVPFLSVMEPLPLELLARVENRGDKFVLVAKTLHFIR